MDKLTKIIATLSDLRCEPEFIRSLYEAGMNAVRINTAHQDPQGAIRLISNVRSVSDKIPIIIDTKGPEVRTKGVLEEIVLKKGDKITIYEKCDFHTGKCFMVTYDRFTDFVDKGNHIMVDDGSLDLEVIEKRNDQLLCEAKNNGIIKSNKSINVPGIDLHLPSLNNKDLMYIDFAIKNDIDFIAHSFVRNKEDVIAIQEILDKHQAKTKIIAKIENQQGVDHLEEILPHVYGVMVARGDLAVEISAEKIPIIQRQIINKCIQNRKIVIVATQMLHTMIENPRPTRAEIADIANAVYTGADAIMLSGETAYGSYPIEAVQVMAKTAIEIEQNKPLVMNDVVVPHDNEISGFLAGTAVRAMQQLAVKLIVCDTHTGKTARYLAAFRGNRPVYAQCYDHRAKRELALVYGIIADYMDELQSKKDFRIFTLNRLIDKKKIEKKDLVLFLAGNFGRVVGPSFVEVGTVENMLHQ